MSCSSMVHILLHLKVKIIVILFYYWETFWLVCTVSSSLVALLLWIELPGRMVSWCTWNAIYFYLVLHFLDGLCALDCLCHQHHTLHLKCDLQCQIHLVNLWIFCWLFTRTYHLWHHLQMVVWWILTYQSDMPMWLSMENSYWVSCCGNLGLHQLWSYSVYVFVCRICWASVYWLYKCPFESCRSSH